MNRLFIIANGPSLRETNLELLEGEEAWGMARIHLLYPETSWRPTRYWWSDHPQHGEHLDDILFHMAQGYDCWFRRDVVDILRGDYKPRGEWVEEAYDKGILPVEVPDYVHAWDYCVHHNSARVGDLNWPDGWHLGFDKVKGGDPADVKLCKFGSGVSAMLQEAWLEGFDPIYVVGADLGFKPRKRGAPDECHFTSDYNNDYYDEYHAWQDNEGHQLLYKYAREWMGDGRVLNATKGGFLKTIPRVDYEGLF